MFVDNSGGVVTSTLLDAEDNPIVTGAVAVEVRNWITGTLLESVPASLNSVSRWSAPVGVLSTATLGIRTAEFVHAKARSIVQFEVTGPLPISRAQLREISALKDQRAFPRHVLDEEIANALCQVESIIGWSWVLRASAATGGTTDPTHIDLLKELIAYRVTRRMSAIAKRTERNVTDQNGNTVWLKSESAISTGVDAIDAVLDRIRLPAIA